MITLEIFGEPKAQPRARAYAMKFGNKYSARMYDSDSADAWKAAVDAALKKTIDEAIEELGNVIYYWARLCRALRISPTQVLAQSQKEIGGVVTKAKRPSRRRAKRVAKRRR